MKLDIETLRRIYESASAWPDDFTPVAGSVWFCGAHRPAWSTDDRDAIVAHMREEHGAEHVDSLPLDAGGDRGIPLGHKSPNAHRL